MEMGPFASHGQVSERRPCDMTGECSLLAVKAVGRLVSLIWDLESRVCVMRWSSKVVKVRAVLQ